MRNWIIGLIICFLLGGCHKAADRYLINGIVTDETDGMIYLKAFRNKMFFVYDSAELKNGQFTFTGKVDQPLLFGLQTANMRYPIQFFVENKEMNVTMTENGSIMVSNSPQNDIFLSNAGLVHQKGFSIDSLISVHPDSPAAAFYLYRYFTYHRPLDELKSDRAKLSPSLNSLPYVQDLDIIIGKLENVEIGKTAPDFTLPDPDGNPVNLSDFRGNYVLVDFWAGWCPPCRKENPNLVKVYEKFHALGFDILGVSLDYDRNQWLKAVADDGLEWKQVSDLKYWDSDIPAIYGVRAIPDNILLDPEGVIINRSLTSEKLQEILSGLYK